MKNQNYICPRCGGFLETLQSYAHCASCLYFEDYWFDTEDAFHKAMKVKKEMIRYHDDINCNKKGDKAHEDKECA